MAAIFSEHFLLSLLALLLLKITSPSFLNSTGFCSKAAQSSALFCHGKSGHGSKSRTPTEHEFTYQPKWDPIGFANRSHLSSAQAAPAKASRPWSRPLAAASAAAPRSGLTAKVIRGSG